MRNTSCSLLLAVLTLALVGCLGAPSGRVPGSGGARRDGGVADSGADEDPYAEDDESGADDPIDPTLEDPGASDPPEEPDLEELDPAMDELDPEDAADAAWLEDLEEEWTDEESDEEDLGETTSACAARCCDGSLATDIEADDAGQCVREASVSCEASGNVLRTRWEGDVEYRRDRSCFARCRSRAGYQRIYGVTAGCTAQASAYCDGNDRGGLADATWSRCTPS